MEKQERGFTSWLNHLLTPVLLETVDSCNVNAANDTLYQVPAAADHSGEYHLRTYGTCHCPV